MTATVVALAPIVAGFVAGHLLRRCGVASARDGNVLLVLNLYVCMPALVLRSLAEVEPTGDLLLFPAAAAVMVAVGYAAGWRRTGRSSSRRSWSSTAPSRCRSSTPCTPPPAWPGC